MRIGIPPAWRGKALARKRWKSTGRCRTYGSTRGELRFVKLF